MIGRLGQAREHIKNITYRRTYDHLARVSGVPMARDIETDEARRLAEEWAALTGESVTTAVTRAIRERLERLRESHGRMEHLLAIGRDCAARL